MRTLTFIIIALTLGLTACEGPMGPTGPEGLPGESGSDFIGTTFEFTGNFTEGNDYQMVFNFLDNGFDPYESDVILAYILWKSADGLDYWRPLPQTEYFESGAILQYNYDFTADIPNNRIVDMAVFLSGDVVFSTLPDEYTLNQTFRVVVVPSDFLNSANVNINNIESILNSENITLKETTVAPVLLEK
nr:hypothetical protein [uncultured Carboxylicivirga sp.]